MGFVERIKSIAAKFNQKEQKREGIYCLSQERGGGAPAPIVLGAIGGLRPSTATAMVRQMTSEQIEAHIKCFDPARGKLLEDVVKKACEANSKVSATKLAQMHRTSVAEIQQRLIDLGYIEDKSGLHYFTERGRDVGGEYRKNHPEASNADGFMVWPADLSI